MRSESREQNLLYRELHLKESKEHKMREVFMGLVANIDCRQGEDVLFEFSIKAEKGVEGICDFCHKEGDDFFLTKLANVKEIKATCRQPIRKNQYLIRSHRNDLEEKFLGKIMCRDCIMNLKKEKHRHLFIPKNERE